jgi:sulfide dehydrogenase cytochrome subunit
MQKMGKSVALALYAWSALALAAPEDDRLLASQCLGCHAADRTGRGGFDRLTGETATEIAEEMIEMRAKSGAKNIMHLQARGYDDAQIQRIAQWFAVNAGSPVSGRSSDDDEDESEHRAKAKSASGRRVSSTTRR